MGFFFKVPLHNSDNRFQAIWERFRTSKWLKFTNVKANPTLPATCNLIETSEPAERPAQTRGAKPRNFQNSTSENEFDFFWQLVLGYVLSRFRQSMDMFKDLPSQIFDLGPHFWDLDHKKVVNFGKCRETPSLRASRVPVQIRDPKSRNFQNSTSENEFDFFCQLVLGYVLSRFRQSMDMFKDLPNQIFDLCPQFWDSDHRKA